MRRTRRMSRDSRNLRLEILERRNLLAFGGLRMFLVSSHHDRAINLDLSAKSMPPAAIATPTLSTPSMPVLQAFSRRSASFKSAAETVDPPVVGNPIPTFINAVATDFSDSATTPPEAPLEKTLPTVSASAPFFESLGATNQTIYHSDDTEFSDFTPISENETILSDDVGITRTDDLTALSVDNRDLDASGIDDVIGGTDDSSWDDLDDGRDDVDGIFDGDSDSDDVGIPRTDDLPGLSIDNNRDLDASGIDDVVGGTDDSSWDDLDDGHNDVDGIFDADSDGDDVGIPRTDDLPGLSIDNNHDLDASGIDDVLGGTDHSSWDDLDDGRDDVDGIFDAYSDGDDVGIPRTDDLPGLSIDNNRDLDASGIDDAIGGIDDSSWDDLDDGHNDVDGILDGDSDSDDVGITRTDDLTGISVDNRDLDASGIDDVVGGTDDSSWDNLDDGHNDLDGLFDGDSDDNDVGIAIGSSPTIARRGKWSASLIGSGTGQASFKNKGHDQELSLRVFGAPANSTLDVVLGSVRVGRIQTNRTGYGRLELENDDDHRSIPIGFPVVGTGTTISVGNALSGVFEQYLGHENNHDD
ncbi:autotransporter outer membrane beta-barrel domain-containing protein [Stieleria varia]|uniref:Uncharacterized protein n=1 Tax=Stieleria varia TaxID=2528005 RepID=A0A5C6B8J6_9BACT|nr:hypothetical protein [Stieleria varia]TWU08413.1 hypothetical protein Pla52n_09960 [Stieleria varia]